MTNQLLALVRVLAATVLLWSDLVGAMSAYNCQDQNATHIMVDLLEPQPCPDPELDYERPRPQLVQILQTDTAMPVSATQCIASISKKVTRCGFDSLTYGSKWTVWDLAYEVTPSECRKAVKAGELKIDGHKFPVTLNRKVTHRFYSQGHLDNEMNCRYEGTFKSGNDYFSKSFEETKIDITLRVIRGTANTATQEVIFVNGIRAKYPDGVARDDLEGTLVWEIKKPECRDTVSELYDGPSELHRRRQESLLDSIILVKNNETQQYAGLVLNQIITLCKVRCFDTQVKGLFVCPYREGDEPLPKHTFKASFTPDQVNLQSQLGYLHTTTNLAVTERFALVQNELCMAARRTLFNKIQAISGAHNVYALLDIYGPGHMVYQAGAVAYVTKCPRVEVNRAEYSNCTHEIPVHHENATLFADPLTRILTDFPTIIPCSDVMPPRWKMGGDWYCSHPRVLPCERPRQLNLSVTPYHPLHDFTTGLGRGIYSAEQLEKHRRFQVAQSSRRPVLAKITNTAAGQRRGTYLGSTLSTVDIDDLTKHISWSLFPFAYFLGDLWRYVSSFMLIALIAKLCIGSAAKAWVGYKRYGCGRWMIISMWNTAHLLITAPWRIVTQTAEAMTAPLDEDSADNVAMTDEPTKSAYTYLLGQVNEMRRELQSLTHEVNTTLPSAPTASSSSSDSTSPPPTSDPFPAVNIHLPAHNVLPPPRDD